VTEAPTARSSVMALKTRLLAIAVVYVSAVAIAAAFAAASGGGMTPRPALVSANGLTVHASVGSYCVDGRPHHGTASSMCADYAYPLHTRGELPVAGGDRVALRFRHNPRIEDVVRSVHVQPLRVHGGNIKPVSSAVAGVRNPTHGSRWHVRLPSDLDGANKLDISITYANGDADFWAGITPGS
jgi:hypothetical protein